MTAGQLLAVTATPQAIVTWLKLVSDQSWADTFWAGQPILGECGSLVGVGVDGAAKGAVVGKTGTSADVEPVSGRLVLARSAGN
ncbi:hypothetical protein E5720_20735 [Rhodococcus sp. PAMC28707]|uniref:hypothetical protein n=1 Tax=unclassified Rhodococcus (in: high G+C Gram-positive bacteria) TaxID=192944 RepID=UPI00109DF0AA|nr:MULTISPECIES: hypothetical protein [unclassified Rhodococcus (in: high G+C Gram-positive bacteria)]QCB51296.1 hypothetical protein E5769_14790 [Rhodococcus sp. PAMC28705]QCB60536.1 hypothetical protein E5720_20735 [Rhodococcus sp. PAMC28707]